MESYPTKCLVDSASYFGDIEAPNRSGPEGRTPWFASVLSDYLPQRHDQRRALVLRPDRDPQKLFDARQFEVAHDDAASP